ncbi:MAG TPA: hypothetical protein VKE74_05280, partial [Gemmataceae bacterium]|nr:hypothetical protein [Gemmataceae bacterium]
MATVTAAAPQAPARPLWQVPTFLVGLAAFLAVWQGWLPLSARDPSAAFLDDLAALKAAGDKLSPDREEIKALLDRVNRNAGSFPEHAPAAHFALGTGYVRLAELSTNPSEAQNGWVLARQHFDEVKPEQLP